jgi:hypothetical protein
MTEPEIENMINTAATSFERETSAPREEAMIELYGTTLARVDEVKRGTLVRRLAGFHGVIDVRSIEDDGVRIWLDDGGTITLGSKRFVKVAR